MFFWQHNDDLTNPPQIADIQRRRPWGKHYWESDAIDMNGAMEGFYKHFKRATGKNPGLPPRVEAREGRYTNIPAIRSRVPKRSGGQTKDKPR